MDVRTSEDTPALSLRGLGAAVRRQAIWIAIISLIGIALTVVVTQRQRPVYEARATIRMADQQSAAPPTDVLAALSKPSTIETEMEILRSRSVVEDVVDTLGLRGTITDPRGAPRRTLFGLLHVDHDAQPGSYVVSRDTTVFSITTPEGRMLGGAYGAPLSAGGVQVEPLPLGATHGGARHITLAVMPTSDAAEMVRQGLRVSRPQPNAGIVAIAYQSTDQTLARDVVNAVAQAYIDRRRDNQRETYHAAVEFLQGQVVTVGAELAQAEKAMEQYRRAHNLIDPEAQASDQVQRRAALEVQKEGLDDQSRVLWDLVRRTKQPAESSGGWAEFAGSGVVAQNTVISSLLAQITGLVAERTQLLSRRTTADPDVVTKSSMIAALQRQLGAVAQGALQSIDDQNRSLEQTVQLSDVRLARVPEQELQFARLKRQVDLNGSLYTLLQTRLKESQVSEASEIANVALVDPAVVPTSPLGGRRFFNLLFGVALSILCGGLVGLARESADTRVRSREELVRLTDLPLLASIPRIRLSNGHRHGGVALQIEDRLVLRHAPRSPAAEAYRALRTNVTFSEQWSKQRLRTIVVTSPEPMDGKTTTAVNLAITLAEQGLRVVLVEADKRRPVLHKVLHTERSPGLSDVLSGTAPLEQALREITPPDHGPGTFSFIPAGSPVSNPAELLGSPAMRELLELLSQSYDQVVLDTPPLCVVTDAAVLATQVDGVLFVARMGATHGDALKRSVEEMRGLGARIVGTVLTDVNQYEDRYGYRYGYYQYYGEESNGNGNGNGNGSGHRNRVARAAKRV
jgi:capsular exopolysaccharide synthesis family protein